MKKFFLISVVVGVAFLVSTSALARDARLDALVNQGKVTEQDIAALEMDAPNAWMGAGNNIMLSGLVQVKVAWLEDGDPETAVDINRARLRVDGMLGDTWGFFLQTEFASGAELLDVGVNAAVGDGTLTFGQKKVPFALEGITSAGKLDTIMRSMIVDEVDNRDAGIYLDYPFLEGKFGIQAAVTNGTGTNVAENNTEKDYWIRVAAKPFQGTEGPADGLLVAGAFNTGEQQELDATGVDLGDFDRTRWIGTVSWVWNQVKVQGEYLNLSQDLAAGGDVETDGWYVLASYDMAVDSMTVTPVAKYETIDPEGEVGGDWVTLGVRLSFVGMHDVKLEANYVMENLDEGADQDQLLLQVTANY